MLPSKFRLWCSSLKHIRYHVASVYWIYFSSLALMIGHQEGRASSKLYCSNPKDSALGTEPNLDDLRESRPFKPKAISRLSIVFVQCSSWMWGTCQPSSGSSSCQQMAFTLSILLTVLAELTLRVRRLTPRGTGKPPPSSFKTSCRFKNFGIWKKQRVVEVLQPQQICISKYLYVGLCK